MTIHLSVGQQRFIRSLIAAGRFASEDAVIAAALQLMQNHGEEGTLARLRRDIGEAINQADRGVRPARHPYPHPGLMCSACMCFALAALGFFR